MTYLYTFCDSTFFSVFYDIAMKVISSFIFIFLLLYLMRPKIEISPYICYTKMKPENHYFYVFKIVNRSLFYTYDINISLVKKVPFMVNKGKKINNRIVEIETSSNYKNHLPKCKRKTGYGDHAYLIRTKYDIKKDVLNKDITVRLSITSKHGLTNLTRVVTKDFLSSDVIIKDKEFKFGSCLDTV